jgi:hypothetical protein
MRLLPSIAAAAALICLSALSPVSRAQTYRWEDQQGHLHFSSEPPPAGAKGVREMATPETSGDTEPDAATPTLRAAGPESFRIPTRTISLGAPERSVSLAVPAGCEQHEGSDPSIVVQFVCSSRVGPTPVPEGLLFVLHIRQEAYGADELEQLCSASARGELKGLVQPTLRDMQIEGVHCDAQRHAFVMSGKMSNAGDFTHIEMVNFPVSDGFAGVAILLRPGSSGATGSALRAALKSATVPESASLWTKPHAAKAVPAKLDTPRAALGNDSGGNAGVTQASAANALSGPPTWVIRLVIGVVVTMVSAMVRRWSRS